MILNLERKKKVGQPLSSYAHYKYTWLRFCQGPKIKFKIIHCSYVLPNPFCNVHIGWKILFNCISYLRVRGGGLGWFYAVLEKAFIHLELEKGALKMTPFDVKIYMYNNCDFNLKERIIVF